MGVQVRRGGEERRGGTSSGWKGWTPTDGWNGCQACSGWPPLRRPRGPDNTHSSTHPVPGREEGGVKEGRDGRERGRPRGETMHRVVHCGGKERTWGMWKGSNRQQWSGFSASSRTRAGGINVRQRQGQRSAGRTDEDEDNREKPPLGRDHSNIVFGRPQSGHERLPRYVYR